MTTTFEKIVAWANDRNLVHAERQQAQMLKLTEEVGELAHAVARNDQAKIEDAIGDCVVVLTILAAQRGVFIESCIEGSYNQIKNRKGKTENGVFVKEGE